MNNINHNGILSRSLVLLLLILSIHVPLALAHGMTLFATVENNEIVGYAYSTDGEPIKNISVSVASPGGKKLGEAKTDDEGKFIFEPEYICDHVFVIDTGDGHLAKWLVEKEGLPTKLKPLEKETVVDAELLDGQRSGFEKIYLPSDEEREEISLELRDLRARFDVYRRRYEMEKDKNRRRDIIAGVGYIAGITGIAFFFLGLLQKRR